MKPSRSLHSELDIVVEITYRRKHSLFFGTWLCHSSWNILSEMSQTWVHKIPLPRLLLYSIFRIAEGNFFSKPPQYAQVCDSISLNTVKILSVRLRRQTAKSEHSETFAVGWLLFGDPPPLSWGPGATSSSFLMFFLVFFNCGPVFFFRKST